MMRRFSLSQRLTLLFILLMMLCATVACAVQLYTSTQYGNAMVQRLSGGLAQQIVQREAILDAQGRVDRTALKPLFDRLMTFNPSVELYVVSPDGEPHIGFTLGDEKLAMSLDCANLLFNQIGDLLESQGYFDKAEGGKCQMH